MPLPERIANGVAWRDDRPCWKRRLIDLPLDYAAYFDNRDLFTDVEAFCLFIGYSRSGHSLLGSLVNAHRRAVVSHELDALRQVELGYRRRPLYGAILRQDRHFASLGRRWTGYDYAVDGLWQGCVADRARVIGDKRGHGTTSRLARDPSALERLRRVVRVPLRVIHHVRNPFDNIATMVHHSGKPLDTIIGTYFHLAATNHAVFRELDDTERIETHHEALVRRRDAELRRVIAWLGLDDVDDWAATCADILFASPRRSRDSVRWTPAQIDAVHQRASRYPFLEHYRFET